MKKRIMFLLMAMLMLSLPACSEMTDKADKLAKEKRMQSDEEYIEVNKAFDEAQEMMKKLEEESLPKTAEDIIAKTEENKENNTASVSHFLINVKQDYTQRMADGTNYVDIHYVTRLNFKYHIDENYIYTDFETNTKIGQGYNKTQNSFIYFDKANNKTYFSEDNDTWKNMSTKEFLNAFNISNVNELSGMTPEMLYNFLTLFKEAEFKTVKNEYVLTKDVNKSSLKDLQKFLSDKDLMTEFDIKDTDVENIIDEANSTSADEVLFTVKLYVNKETFNINKMILDYSNMVFSNLIKIKEYTITFENLGYDDNKISLPETITKGK